MKKSFEERTELEKKWQAEAEQEAEESAPTHAVVETEPEKPEVDVAGLQRERDELADRLLRSRAEFENFRKRVARDSDRMRRMAAEALIRDLLPVADHLELALQHKDGDVAALADGVALVARQFQEVLARHGVEAIEAAGRPFDPNLHEAVMQRESDSVPANSVIEEFQRGYKLGAVVLRPAKVVVAGAPETVSETTMAEDTCADLTGEPACTDPHSVESGDDASPRVVENQR
jgi:molecular chaperone GrpE